MEIRALSAGNNVKNAVVTLPQRENGGKGTRRPGGGTAGAMLSGARGNAGECFVGTGGQDFTHIT